MMRAMWGNVRQAIKEAKKTMSYGVQEYLLRSTRTPRVCYYEF